MGGRSEGGGRSRWKTARSTRRASDDTRIGFVVSDQSFQGHHGAAEVQDDQRQLRLLPARGKRALAGYEVEIDEAKGTGGFWETGANGRKWVTGPEDNAAVKAGEWNEMAASLHGHKIVFHVNGLKTMEL